MSLIQPVGFFRRLAALLYDAILMLSVFIIASFPYHWLLGQPGDNLSLLWGYRLYLWLVGFVLIGTCWHLQGQTLGMKAWKIKVVNSIDNHFPSWRSALLRYCWATISLLTCGIGYVIALLHPRSQALHDIFSSTHLVKIDN